MSKFLIAAGATYALLGLPTWCTLMMRIPFSVWWSAYAYFFGLAFVVGPAVALIVTGAIKMEAKGEN